MSANLIDDLTECEAKELLNEICAKLHILGKHRRLETILKGLDTELKFLKSIKQVSEMQKSIQASVEESIEPNNFQSCEAAQAKIDIAKAEFFKDGGEVEQLAAFGIQTKTVNPITKKRKPCSKKSIVLARIRKCLNSNRGIAYLYVENGEYSCKGKEHEESETLKFIRSFKTIGEVNGYHLAKLL